MDLGFYSEEDGKVLEVYEPGSKIILRQLL